jgi:hypothetical protein
MRVETEFKERSTQLSFRARRRPRQDAKRHVGNEVAPTFRIGGRGIPLEVLVTCDRSVPSTNVLKAAALSQMRRKLDWTNRFNALDSLDKPLYCAIVELSLNAKEEWAMLSRCANPDCGTNFDHGHGRFFRFRRSSSPVPVNSHSVQHHWLCDSCSETYTLDYREAIGILLSLRLRTPNDGYIPLLIAEA